MQVTIDKAGRIVVPKPTRDRYGLRAESKLELVENDEGFQLKPTEKATRLVRRPNGRFMIAGPGMPGTDWKNLVGNMREEHIRKITGR